VRFCLRPLPFFVSVHICACFRAWFSGSLLLCCSAALLLCWSAARLLCCSGCLAARLVGLLFAGLLVSSGWPSGWSSSWSSLWSSGLVLWLVFWLVLHFDCSAAWLRGCSATCSAAGRLLVCLAAWLLSCAARRLDCAQLLDLFYSSFVLFAFLFFFINSFSYIFSFSISVSSYFLISYIYYRFRLITLEYPKFHGSICLLFPIHLYSY